MGTGCSDLGYEIPVVTAIVPPSLVWQEFGISLQREVILERDMTTRPRRDVVARLVSKKRSSYKEESSESSSESSEEEVVQLPDVEDRSYEQVQEEAGRCSHGPPTDYPCHICCYNKWNKTRRLEQPGVEKAKGKPTAAGGDHEVILTKATNEPLTGGSNAETRESVKSKEKKREHSEERGRDGADVLFDGIKIGHKAKKTDDGGLEKPTNAGGKSYTYNSLPGITITNLGPSQASSASKGAKEHITPQEQEEMVTADLDDPDQSADDR